jgi:hypothetical protein
LDPGPGRVQDHLASDRSLRGRDLAAAGALPAIFDSVDRACSGRAGAATYSVLKSGAREMRANPYTRLGVSGVAWLLLLNLFSSGGRAADGDVLVLPPFEVRETVPWVIAESPNISVLSLASEWQTGTFANRLQDSAWLTPLLLPPGVDGHTSARAAIFLRHFATDLVARRLSTNMALNFQAFAFSVFWQDNAIFFPTEEASRIWGWGREYLNLDFLRVTGLTHVAVPAWYRDGMSELLRSATLAEAGVIFPAQGWRPNGNRYMDNPIISGLFPGGPAPWMPLREVLSRGAQARSSSSRFGSAEQRERYLRGAAIFVHWGFFADKGKHRAAFLDFVAEATRRPPDEEMLRRILGFDFKKIQARLDSRGLGVSRETIAAPAGHVLATRIHARSATRGDVARIVGEAYLHLAREGTQATRVIYLTNAREVLEDAVKAGEGDSLIAYLLGMLAQLEGDDETAIRWLEQAVAGEVRRPSAYVMLVELLLKRRSFIGPGTISADETTAIWQLLKKADSMRPRLAGTYSLGLGLWRDSAISPDSAALALLADGIDAFPGDSTLVTSALQLAARRRAEMDSHFMARLEGWRGRLGMPRIID